MACVVPALVPMHADLHENKAKLSPNMLALMTELEKQGPHFAAKMLITILGEQRGAQGFSRPSLIIPPCHCEQECFDASQPPLSQ